jgi:hypothetical protein
LISQRAQSWSGFAWEVRTDLLARYGLEAGQKIANSLFLTPLETDAPDIPSAVAEVFARLSEGQSIQVSPDFGLLSKAAIHHGLLPTALAK